MGGCLATCARESVLPTICRKEGPIEDGRMPCDLRTRERATNFTSL